MKHTSIYYVLYSLHYQQKGSRTPQYMMVPEIQWDQKTVN